MKRGLIAACITACLIITASGLSADTNEDLSDAAAFGDIERVRHSVVAGADVNAPDNNGCPPLIHAARSGNVETIKFLISKGALVNVRDTYEMTPLMHAALSGHAEAVRYLVDRGADIHARAKSGKTAFEWAHNKAIARILKEQSRKTEAAEPVSARRTGH